MDKNGNENALKGYECPECGSTSLAVTVSTLAELHDDGTDAECGDHHWDGDSHMECRDCFRSGTSKDFVILTEAERAVKAIFSRKYPNSGFTLGELRAVEVTVEGEDD